MTKTLPYTKNKTNLKKKFELAGKVKKLKEELKQMSVDNNGGKTNG